MITFDYITIDALLNREEADLVAQCVYKVEQKRQEDCYYEDG